MLSLNQNKVRYNYIIFKKRHRHYWLPSIWKEPNELNSLKKAPFLGSKTMLTFPSITSGVCSCHSSLCLWSSNFSIFLFLSSSAPTQWVWCWLLVNPKIEGTLPNPMDSLQSRLPLQVACLLLQDKHNSIVFSGLVLLQNNHSNKPLRGLFLHQIGSMRSIKIIFIPNMTDFSFYLTPN